MKANLIIIETDADHAEAKALASKLMASQEPDDILKLTAQARLIEAYENNRWPRRTPEIADVLTYIMDQHDLSRADMAEILGTASRVSEVLTGKRELSMTMVQRLRERFHVSADLLIPPVSRMRKRVAA
jgi:HTH-type transcriptional regulator/antitoxin HigA